MRTHQMSQIISLVNTVVKSAVQEKLKCSEYI